MIVCLEGVDLCGKGTLTRLLAAALEAAVQKFPDQNTDTGKLIYGHLDSYWKATHGDPELMDGMLDATVFQALQTVNRLEKAEEVARFRRPNAKWLVLDRYWPSGVVFGGADGLDVEWLKRIHSSLPQPDYFFLLDIDYEQVVERMKGLGRPPDRYESDTKVKDRIARYRKLWAEKPVSGASWITVDARKEPAMVLASVMHTLRKD